MVFGGGAALVPGQVFTLTLCYSLMAPLITIFGFAYFCLVFLINRYNLIYVNEQRWQGGGMRLAFPSALPEFCGVCCAASHTRVVYRF